ncbi:MAG: ABC transporter ATP-binding protein [Christensenellales bacterium]
MKDSASVSNSVLSVEKVCKRFGGVVAADDISLKLFSGEIFGLIGPNGSGKTTLLNMISGVVKMDSGVITLLGENISNKPSYTIARKGILRTFQHPRLLQRCDINTNIILGNDLAAKRSIGNSNKREDFCKLLLKTARLDNINLKDSIDKLSYGQKKLLEIVRSLLAEPVVLLLDEPAAGLNNKEMEYVVELIEIAVSKNVAVLLIEHSMDLVMSICHRITVLNFGQQIASGGPADIQHDPLVIEAYLGGSQNAED